VADSPAIARPHGAHSGAPEAPTESRRHSLIGRFLGGIGRSIRVRVSSLYAIFIFSLAVVKAFLREREHGRLVVAATIYKQIRFTGVDAIGLVVQVAALVGVVVGLTVTVLANSEVAGGVEQGLSQQFTPIVQLLFLEFATTTISPLLISLILIARSGTAIASELALMQIRGEISALRAMGVNVDYFIVWPRILGMAISMIGLVILFNFVLVAVHFVVVNGFANNEGVQSVAQIERASRLINLLQAMLKTGIIGAGIATVSCYFGLLVKQSFTEVPRAATRAVVNSIVFGVIANVVIFIVFFFLFGFAVTNQ